mmetsp:Transcript_23088/g.50846  ORF Transcript_23088/g.50846 Transcript_23088/m.50846 type:complete len:414 (+) Transcript_23088:31-1272(+)
MAPKSRRAATRKPCKGTPTKHARSAVKSTDKVTPVVPTTEEPVPTYFPPAPVTWTSAADSDSDFDDGMNQFDVFGPARKRMSKGLAGAALPQRSTATPEELLALPLPEHQAARIEEQRKKFRNVEFERWATWLVPSNKNLLVSGLGSKRDMLQEFAQFIPELVSPLPINVVCCDAFHREFNFRESVSGIVLNVLGRDMSTATCMAMAQFLKTGLEDTDMHVVWVIQEIDSLSMQPHMKLLAYLFGKDSPNLHLVASVGHVNFALAFPVHVWSALRFVQLDTNTYEPYTYEVLAKHGGKLPRWTALGGDKEEAMKNTVDIVLASLTPNHKKFTGRLAMRQAELLALGEKKFKGFHINDLLTISKKDMVAINLTRLKTLLVELLSHKIVIEQEGMYRMPFPMEELQVIGETHSGL